jgi:hypothetical protein
LPEVLAGNACLCGVAGVMGKVQIVAGVLCGVAHPHIVGTHIGGVIELINLPPVVIGQALVATCDLFGAFFLGGEVVGHILLAKDWLFEEIRTA